MKSALFAMLATATTLALNTFMPGSALAADELQGDTFVHDPTLWIESGVHYVFSTGPGLQRLRSPDGVSWTRLAPVFNEANRPAWWAVNVPAHKGIDVWAPKLFPHGGRFHVMYSISTFGSRQSAIGIASAATPDAAQWRDDGIVVTSGPSDDYNAIDPDVFIDDDSRIWMSYGSFWGGIRMTELDTATLRPKGETRFVASHRPGIEAPTLMKRNGSYYLFVSWGYCCRGVDSTYNIRVGRGASPMGPFLDREGVDMLKAGGTLVEEGGERWKGPGHQDVFGNWLARHSYDVQAGGKSRLRLSAMNWSADGWPTP